MKILFFGDIMGRSGRDALHKHLPALRSHYSPDYVIANAENAAGGYGLSQKIADDLVGLGIDCLTTGNHVWDQKDLLSTIGNTPHILRPCNFPKGTPGNGSVLLTTKNNLRLLVINVMGRLFMDAMDDPFVSTQTALGDYVLGKNVDAIFVDAHAEASSEKQAIAHYLDGRVSAVIGSHTHVPTADARILTQGTAFQTDAGMCGDYDSVIGMNKDASTQKMLRKYSFERLKPAEGEGSVCGCFIETDMKTGLAKTIQPIRIGGSLAQTA